MVCPHPGKIHWIPDPDASGDLDPGINAPKKASRRPKSDRKTAGKEKDTILRFGTRSRGHYGGIIGSAVSILDHPGALVARAEPKIASADAAEQI